MGTLLFNIFVNDIFIVAESQAFLISQMITLCIPMAAAFLIQSFIEHDMMNSFYSFKINSLKANPGMLIYDTWERKSFEIYSTGPDPEMGRSISATMVGRRKKF